MISFHNTNLLKSDAEALVNTVNTVGIMGKGVALQFKEHFPLNFKLYQKACEAGALKLGKVFVTETGQLTGPRYIVNFPTKADWRSFSKLNTIADGLDDLVRVIREKNIQSIAVPPLGCGNGGLDWQEVKPLIVSKLSPLSNSVKIEVYEPGHHSYTKTTSNGIAKLTKARALTVALADRYNVLGFDISHLEIQKLAYFLQELGQTDLKLNYEKGHYGPYATNLKHLLAHLEGSYFKGQIRFQDMKPTDSLQLVKEHLPEVNKVIDTELTVEEKNRMERLSQLIEGFESPFGLELLATIHWAKKELGEKTTLSAVESYIHNWSVRKKESMNTSQIEVGLQRVNQFFS
ncbi:MAG: macro domain-containing protein [Bacteroidetes bacterium]|nr:macro domain-containing protein [Bacteroidota bacterium]